MEAMGTVIGQVFTSLTGGINSMYSEIFKVLPQLITGVLSVLWVFVALRHAGDFISIVKNWISKFSSSGQ